MAPFTYRCPDTGFRIQEYSAEPASEDGGADYEAVTCTMCGRVHVMNPTTGEVLGQDEE
jgi:hypothetical protein